MRTIIETSPGRYKDPETNKRTSKQEGDKVVTAEQYEAANSGSAKPAAKPKAERKPVTLSTGIVTTDPTIEIKCSKRGCPNTRVIKKQDKFQVKFCLEHQKENRNALRRKRREDAKKASSKS